MTEFDCPECDHVSQHWTPFTGMLTVMWHMYFEHPQLSTDVGNPFKDETGPEWGAEE